MTTTSNSALVSVIIPTYNRAQLIGEMISSLVAQTYRPLEIIVSDDGSTDNTRDLVDELFKRSRSETLTCEYVINAKANADYARNRGFEHSHGDYVIFLDSDDVASPTMIQRMVAALREADADFCVCDNEHFIHFPGDLGLVVPFSERGHRPEDHLVSLAMNVSTLFRRSALEKIGPWDERLTAWDDVEFTFRALLCLRGTWIPEPSYLVRVRAHRVVNTGRGLEIRREINEQGFQSMVLARHAMRQFAQDRGCLSVRLRRALGQSMVALARMGRRRGFERGVRQALGSGLALLPLPLRVVNKAHWGLMQFLGVNFLKGWRVRLSPSERRRRAQGKLRPRSER